MKIVLLGDSIRMIGYGQPVAQRLSGKFEIWQPTENCRFAKHTLRGLWDWQKNLAGADIIHWNNGLWDICELYGDGPFTPLEEYVDAMLRLARLLKQRARTVIFATTTPVREDNPHNRNAMIEAYNKALVPKLMELGIVINDLYTPLADDVQRYISDDKIHLSKEGIALAADAVEAIILREAQRLDGETTKQGASDDAVETGAPV